MKKLLISVILALIGLAPTADARAATISYHFVGTASSDVSAGFWNIAYPGGTIEGVFTFDDSLFSGAGFYTVQGNSDRKFIDQEYPSAFISFTYTHTTAYGDPTLISSSAETYPVVRTTARPDLKYVDFNSALDGVGFIFDNMDDGTLGGWMNMSFDWISVLDDPQDLIGATGKALFKRSYQQLNMGYEYGIEVTEIVGNNVPEPQTFALVLAGLGFLVFRCRHRNLYRIA